MPFLGTLVDFFAILVFGIIGSFVKKGIPKRFNDTIMGAMAICVAFIGIDGALEAAPHLSDNAYLSDGLVKLLIMIISLGVGALIGELIDIDKWVTRLGGLLEKKFSGADTSGNFAKGFVNCSLLCCVGAMAVNGAILDATGKPDVLLAKSVIDSVTALVLGSSFGIGVAFSAFLVLIYQGAISLIGIFLSGLLPAYSITYMSITGSLVIVLVGLNVLGCTKIKTANLIPAIFLPAIIAPLFDLLL